MLENVIALIKKYQSGIWNQL